MAIQSNKSSKSKNEKAAPPPAAKAPAKAPAAPPAPVKPAKAASAAKSYDPTQEEIQTRAFELYLSEGCKQGSDLENWLRAEKDLRARGPR